MKTKKSIKDYQNGWYRLTREQEQAILEYWGNEIGNEFMEQDIHEQTLKIIAEHKKPVKAPLYIQKMKY